MAQHHILVKFPNNGADGDPEHEVLATLARTTSSLSPVPILGKLPPVQRDLLHRYSVSICCLFCSLNSSWFSLLSPWVYLLAVLAQE